MPRAQHPTMPSAYVSHGTFAKGRRCRMRRCPSIVHVTAYATRRNAPLTSRPGRIQRVAHAGTYATGCFIAWDGTTLLSGYTPRVITRHTTGHTAHRSTPQLSTAHRDARPHNTHRIALHHGAPRHITPHHAAPQHNTTQRITANSAHASYRLRSAAGNTKCMFSLTVST